LSNKLKMKNHKASNVKIFLAVFISALILCQHGSYGCITNGVEIKLAPSELNMASLAAALGKSGRNFKEVSGSIIFRSLLNKKIGVMAAGSGSIQFAVDAADKKEKDDIYGSGLIELEKVIVDELTWMSKNKVISLPIAAINELNGNIDQLGLVMRMADVWNFVSSLDLNCVGSGLDLSELK